MKLYVDRPLWFTQTHLTAQNADIRRWNIKLGNKLTSRGAKVAIFLVIQGWLEHPELGSIWFEKSEEIRELDEKKLETLLKKIGSDLEEYKNGNLHRKGELVQTLNDFLAVEIDLPLGEYEFKNLKEFAEWLKNKIKKIDIEPKITADYGTAIRVEYPTGESEIVNKPFP